MNVYNDFRRISCGIIPLPSRWGPISPIHLFSIPDFHIIQDLFSSVLFMCISILESQISGIRIFHFVITFNILLGCGKGFATITVIIYRESLLFFPDTI